MSAPLVVVADIDAENAVELAAAEGQQAVAALPPEAADPTLDVRVRVRRLERSPDDAHPFAVEDDVERAAEFRVAIMDEKPKWLLVAELVGCSYSVSCCDCFVFVDESAEHVASADSRG